ncbi:CBS domain-containing protein [Candidatus Nitrospira bockiana]
MGMPGVPAEGLKTVGQITPTNGVRFRSDQEAADIATELVRERTTGAPVVDAQGRIVGFISEIDLLRAARGGCDLRKLRAEDIMTRCPISVSEHTTISEAIDIMDACHLLNLPVQREGQVSYSVTRHDLLRATIGFGSDMEAFGHS